MPEFPPGDPPRASALQLFSNAVDIRNKLTQGQLNKVCKSFSDAHSAGKISRKGSFTIRIRQVYTEITCCNHMDYDSVRRDFQMQIS